MKVLITKFRITAGKKDPSKNWAMGHWLGEDGSGGDFVVDASTLPEGFALNAALTPAEVKELFETYHQADMAFNDRGRVESLTAVA